MVWLTVVWAHPRSVGHEWGTRRSGPFGVGRVLPEEVPLAGIAASHRVAHFRGFCGSPVTLRHAANLASGPFYLGARLPDGQGYRPSRATRAETQEFLGEVVIANTVACGLFVSPGPGAASADLPGAGEHHLHLRRTRHHPRFDVFAPALNLLALGFVLAKRRWTPRLACRAGNHAARRSRLPYANVGHSRRRRCCARNRRAGAVTPPDFRSNTPNRCHCAGHGRRRFRVQQGRSGVLGLLAQATRGVRYCEPDRAAGTELAPAHDPPCRDREGRGEGRHHVRSRLPALGNDHG